MRQARCTPATACQTLPLQVVGGKGDASHEPLSKKLFELLEPGSVHAAVHESEERRRDAPCGSGVVGAVEAALPDEQRRTRGCRQGGFRKPFWRDALTGAGAAGWLRGLSRSGELD